MNTYKHTQIYVCVCGVSGMPDLHVDVIQKMYYNLNALCYFSTQLRYYAILFLKRCVSKEYEIFTGSFFHQFIFNCPKPLHVNSFSLFTQLHILV